MKHSTKLLVLFAAIVGTIGLAAAGWAYWTSTGAGSASAMVGTLNAPTGVGATSPGSGLVDVSWTGVPANGDIVVSGYYVRRGTTNVCGSPASPLASTATTCHDTNLAQGTYTYTVTAIWRSWTANTSASPLTLSAGPPKKLAFGQQPTAAVSQQSIAPPATVRILDADGNLTTSTANVSVAIGTNPNGGTLSGTKTVNAVGGTATFSGLVIDKAGTGYTLAVTSTALTGATSSPFNITAGAANKLAFGQQPTSTTGGVTIAPRPTVQILDAADNLTPSTASVTVAMGTNPSGGTLSGTTTVVAAGGVATFSGLSIDKVGTGYTLAVTSSGLTGITSSTFNISVGPPARLTFGQQPSNTLSQQSMSPAPTVRIVDAGGNQTTNTAMVTLAIGSNPSSGALAGTKTVNAVGGTATFTGLSIDKAGTGYTLGASSVTLASATSNGFNITAGPPNKLGFAQQPTNTTAGQAISAPVTVRILDAAGNLTSSTANVTVAIGTNPASGTLSGTKTVPAVNGTATFSTLSIDKAGAGYTIAATGIFTGATSSAFSITAAPPAGLCFSEASSCTGSTSQNVPQNTSFSSHLSLIDAFGNRTTYSADVLVTVSQVGSNDGSVSPGTITITAGQTTSSGVVTLTSSGQNNKTTTASASGSAGTTALTAATMGVKT
jgi:hypothetical protein